jgi:hypothetical protein
MNTVSYSSGHNWAEVALSMENDRRTKELKDLTDNPVGLTLATELTTRNRALPSCF